ncbi:hypothetical protein C7T94_09075 [Pedobacter yulinensis]|uniref:Uncharacterized protein n=1 Tax=Pedobacter yulinensis TaxID=2126353 RepID=A0A2T3HK27_9SPHI|nr:hypothetical protein C7T94_09075 [Pedobacter yulinensis]
MLSDFFSSAPFTTPLPGSELTGEDVDDGPQANSSETPTRTKVDFIRVATMIISFKCMVPAPVVTGE